MAEQSQTTGFHVLTEDKPSGWRIVMRHPNGTAFMHTGSLLEKLRDWRVWLVNYRHGYRFGVQR